MNKSNKQKVSSWIHSFTGHKWSQISDSCEIEESPEGHKWWYMNGKLHREDGPSSIWADGLVTYTNKQGYLHRVGGPAVIMPDGTKEWWINSKHLYSILPDGTIQWKIKMNYEYLYRNRPDGPDAYGWRSNSWAEILKYAD
jgi:hypothetical protein